MKTEVYILQWLGIIDQGLRIWYNEMEHTDLERVRDERKRLEDVPFPCEFHIIKRTIIEEVIE